MTSRHLIVRGRPAIGTGLSSYVIAEIGTNHNQSLATARAMLQALARTGCDCAKFQVYEPDEIVSARVRASDYGFDQLYGDISAQEMFERYLKTPKAWFPELRDLCHALGMDFSATIHGPNGLQWAREVGLDVVKIASMDHTNLPLLTSLVNAVESPILVSIGMARFDRHRCRRRGGGDARSGHRPVSLLFDLSGPPRTKCAWRMCRFSGSDISVPWDSRTTPLAWTRRLTPDVRVRWCLRNT